MAEYSEILALSPLPMVDLDEISLPNDGFYVSLPAVCKRNWNKNLACIEHYKSVRVTAALSPSGLVQCPYGFSSFPIKTAGKNVALTALIPFPRLGGAHENQLSKTNKNSRIERSSIERIADGIKRIDLNIKSLETETVRRYSVAFHEIRKLNRNVNQTAERLCRAENSSVPEAANPELVKIWKTAEIMVKQFEVMELLANEELTKLPLVSHSDPYKLFDKCIRVFGTLDSSKRIIIKSSPAYRVNILVCDKTFPIIATVLLQNAIKYSQPHSEIRVFIEGSSDLCKITVTSVSDGQELLNNSIFQRGVRGATETQGSGNGLYLAQLVARQHGTRISVESTPIDLKSVRHTFTIPFIPSRSFY